MNNNGLNGTNSLSYLGVNSTTPPQMLVSKVSPVPANYQFPLGTFWLNSVTGDVYILVKIFENVATWSPFTGGSIEVETLTGNSGGAVGPTNGNINTIGDGTTITIVGYPGTSTLTASTAGTVATSYVANSGTAVPSAGVLNVEGDGTTITISGSGNTLTVSALGSSALTLLSQQHANNVASLTFTGISSTYDNYLLIYNDAVLSSLSETDYFIAQINTGSGYITTGYSAGSGASTAGLVVSGGFLSTNSIQSATVWLYNFTTDFYPNLNNPMSSFNGTFYDNSQMPTITTTTDASVYPNSEHITSFQVITAGGNNFFGNFSLYGFSL